MPDKNWIIYILQCADDTLYTGITDDLPARLEKHTAGRGAKYTRGRAPFTVVYKESAPDRKVASQREHQIKALSRTEKMSLIQTT